MKRFAQHSMIASLTASLSSARASALLSGLLSALRPALLSAATGLCAASALAQDYPARPITVIIPFSAGSASDVIGRVVLERMGQSIGRAFIVDNRPAAGGNVGTQAVARAEPDGYTILMSTSGPLAVNKVLNANLGYDPERDLAPISLYANLPNVVVVSAKLPINTLAEFTD